MDLRTLVSTKLIETATELFGNKEKLGFEYKPFENTDLTASFLLGGYYKDAAPFNQITQAALIGAVDDSSINKGKQEKLSIESADSALLKLDPDYESLFIAAFELTGQPKRAELAMITRAMNRRSKGIPVIVLFKYGNKISIAASERTSYKAKHLKGGGEKVGKVSIIYDIDLVKPHAGHREILKELGPDRASRKVKTFREFYAAVRDVFDVELLNKRFYNEVYTWYENAKNTVVLAIETDEEKSEDERAQFVIRLLTRFMFCWFIKEKGLVPDTLFDFTKLENYVHDLNNNNSNYYKAILQNLFFATLNTPMEKDQPGSRKFVVPGQRTSVTSGYGISMNYRYPGLFKVTEERALALFEGVPFLNGGLFECLDSKEGDKWLRYDAFTMNETNDKQVAKFSVPNNLFSASDSKGLIDIFNQYKFTISENTPIEIEVALDPELLGKIFENLLATYSPETSKSARKQTGSFYTPRAIVDFMVDQSLKTYLTDKISRNNSNAIVNFEAKINLLFEEQIQEDNTRDNLIFTEQEAGIVVDHIQKCKVLDPACGSGAFPMGVLHKMVTLLNKLDPKNKLWRKSLLDQAEADLELAESMQDPAIKEAAIEGIQNRIDYINNIFKQQNHALNYLRKLFLIENCIYGLDIQPIAVQISKLRFFISLIIEQDIDRNKPNLDVISLPNLETKFIAADSLMPLQSLTNGSNRPITTSDIEKLQHKLAENRKQLFFANDWQKKLTYKQKDKTLRTELKTALTSFGFGNDAAEKLASWDPYNTQVASPFFDASHMYGPEFASGFDIVIGNPPYAQVLKSKYPSTTYPYAEGLDPGKQNLYKLFIEQSYNVLTKHGISCLIVQSSLMCDISSKGTRKLLFDNTNNIHLIEIPKSAKNIANQVFESVLQGTCILYFKKDLYLSNIGVSFGNDLSTLLNPEFVYLDSNELKSKFPDTLYIPLVDNKGYKIMNQVLNSCSKLSTYLTWSSQGDINLTEYKHTFGNEKTTTPLIRGNHVHKYIVTHDNKDFCKPEYDVIKEYSKKNLINEYIVIQQITGTTDRFRIHAALSKAENVVYANSLNKISTDKKFIYAILGILNSTFMDWWFRRISTNNHVMLYQLVDFPIPSLTPELSKIISKQVKDIIKAKKLGIDSSSLELTLDSIVFQAYGLTDEDCSYILASN